MFCTECGNKVGENEKFCRKCGTKLQNNVHEPKPLNKLDNRCDSCGAGLKKLSAGHYVCEYCGSEYFTNEKGEVSEAKLTERETLDAMYRAAQFEKKNQFWEELQCLLEASERAPDNAILLVKLGRAYRRNNMYAKAVECYEKSIKINPSYGNAYVNLGTIYILEEQYAKAEQSCRKGIELMNANRIEYTNGDYAIAHSNCAIAVGKQGRKEEAKRLLKIAENNGYKNGDAARKMIGIKKGLFG